MNLTANERKALERIRDSEYQDGDDREAVVGHEVWTSYCNPFASKRTFSGVIASLSKKGLVKCGGSSYDANYEAGCDGTTLALTGAGFDAIGPKGE